MSNTIYILGASGHAWEVAAIWPWPGMMTQFINAEQEGDIPHGAPCIMGVGEPALRRAIARRLGDRVSWRSIYAASPTGCCEFGEGVVVCPGAMLTTNIIVGELVLLNQGCSVGHDVRIGSYSAIAPLAAVSGKCTIGEAVMLGAGCVILPGVSVGDGAKVGAGAVVVRDVHPGATVFGNPAREAPCG